MIELIDELSGNVLGVRTRGKVTGEDYETVLMPAIDRILAEHDTIRLLFVAGDDLESFTVEAMWDDAKLGMKHMTKFDRIAFVTNKDWLKNSVKMFGFLIPCEVQTYGMAGYDDAAQWIQA